MDIKKIKKGDFLKLKKGVIECEVVEVGNDFRSGKDYIKLYNDVTQLTKTLVDISNYEIVYFCYTLLCAFLIAP